jgi:predicted dehydrogenase
MLKIALFGVSHWHLHLYLDPVIAGTDTTVAGIADPNSGVAEGIARQIGCDWSLDYRELCRKVKPDFVFVLGRHCDMPEAAQFLMDEDIPFAMEKPCGVSAADVKILADRVRSESRFAAIPFVLRQGSMLAKISELAADDIFEYMSFKWIGANVAKYDRAGVSWMLDKSLSGGGCLLNLGVHYLDLMAVLLPGQQLSVKSAAIGNKAWGRSIEDYALVTLMAGDTVASVETGYIYPSTPFDLRYSIRTDHHYFIATDPSTLEVRDPAGNLTTYEVVTTNNAVYPFFVADVLERMKDGRSPVAGMDDMLDVMRLVESAYTLGGTLVPRQPLQTSKA